MEYYYFAGGDHTKRINYLKTYGFSGALFTYSPFNQDYFIRIIENFKTQKIKDFKFLVAIRPYVISPQYLRMISSAINRITENSVVINLISGTIKENEKNCEGIVGNINDYSSKEERSDYLVKFLKEDFKMKNNNPGIQQNNIVVTTTNEKVFNVASSLKYKMIIPYFFYKSGHWLEDKIDKEGRYYKTWGSIIDFKDKDIILVIYPVLRQTKKEIESLSKIFPYKNAEFYTYEDLYQIIKKIESDGIKYLMFGDVPEEEENVMKFMHWLKEREKNE